MISIYNLLTLRKGNDPASFNHLNALKAKTKVSWRNEILSQNYNTEILPAEMTSDFRLHSETSVLALVSSTQTALQILNPPATTAAQTP